MASVHQVHFLQLVYRRERLNYISCILQPQSVQKQQRLSDYCVHSDSHKRIPHTGPYLSSQCVRTNLCAQITKKTFHTKMAFKESQKEQASNLYNVLLMQKRSLVSVQKNAGTNIEKTQAIQIQRRGYQTKYTLFRQINKHTLQKKAFQNTHRYFYMFSLRC